MKNFLHNKKDEKTFIADLNYPVNEQLNLNQYDLVTDFGNNEHPFNVAESYRSMHSLTNKMVTCLLPSLY